VRDGLPRQTSDEAYEPGARAIGQAELELRCLHAARDDVDDAAETARHHGVHGEPHHFDGREHHCVERSDPVIARPVAEIAGQRSVGIVEKDIGLRTRGKCSRAPRAGGDVGGNRGDLDGRRRRNLRAGFFQRLAPTRDDGDVDAFLRQREGAGPPQTAARAAQ
jgi:hypothetical protein